MLQQRTVLIVDSDASSRQKLGRALQRFGHAAELVASAQEAVASVARARPDVVIIDLRLTGVGGHTLLRELTKRCPGIPVVVTCGDPEVDDLVLSMRLGARDFIYKPSSPTDLMDVLDRAFASLPVPGVPAAPPAAAPPAAAPQRPPEPPRPQAASPAPVEQHPPAPVRAPVPPQPGRPPAPPRPVVPPPSAVFAQEQALARAQAQARALVQAQADAQAQAQAEAQAQAYAQARAQAQAQPAATAVAPAPMAQVAPVAVPHQNRVSEALFTEEARTLVATAAGRIAAGTLALPALGEAGLALERVSRMPNSAVARVVELVSRDRGLAGTVLGAANAYRNSNHPPIVTVRDACVRLGNLEVFALAKAYAVGGLYITRRAPWVRIGTEMLRNAVVTAHGARELACLMPKTNVRPDQAQVAGFLHNVGEAVGLYLLASACPEVPDTVEAETLRREVASIIGPAHQAIGAAVLVGWNIPSRIVGLAADHHEVPPPGEMIHELEQVRLVVQLSWSIAVRLGYTHDPDAAPLDIPRLCTALGLGEDVAERAFRRAKIWARLRR